MKTKANKVKAQPAPFLEKVAGFMPVARGSLALVRKACGKPGCKACKSGRKHPAWLCFCSPIDKQAAIIV